MIYEKETEWTCGKYIQLFCDCEEFRNNTAMTCRHIQKEQESRLKEKEEKNNGHI